MQSWLSERMSSYGEGNNNIVKGDLNYGDNTCRYKRPLDYGDEAPLVIVM